MAPEMKLMILVLKPTWLERIKEKQTGDSSFQGIRSNIKEGHVGGFHIDDTGVLQFRDRLCVPIDTEI